MPLQVQQLLTQVDQLTDDREALDKQVMPAAVAAQQCTAVAFISICAIGHLLILL